MLSAMRAVDNLIAGAHHDIWAVNVESAYHEEQTDADTEQPYKRLPDLSPGERAERERITRLQDIGAARDEEVVREEAAA
jgi:hypothetical protein